MNGLNCLEVIKGITDITDVKSVVMVSWSHQMGMFIRSHLKKKNEA